MPSPLTSTTSASAAGDPTDAPTVATSRAAARENAVRLRRESLRSRGVILAGSGMGFDILDLPQPPRASLEENGRTRRDR